MMQTNRLEAFSDGVFTIAITLLVLEIKAPTSGADLGPALLALWPSYLAYATSFIVIGAIWINHHAMFEHIARADQKMLLLNTFHLMFIAFLPFPTAVLAEALHSGKNQPLATAFYGLTLSVIGVLVVCMWAYAAHGHRLLSDRISKEAATRRTRTVFYAIGSALALIAPSVALACFIALNVFFLWPRDASGRLQAGASSPNQ
jgi:uncharacterized membrane protein